MTPSPSLTVAAVQMSSQENVAHNLATASRLVAEAAARGAKLVLLPENFAFMGPEEEKRALAETIVIGAPEPGAPPGHIVQALGDAARHAGVHVIAGGMPERSDDPDRPYNTCLVVGPDGQPVARYRKIHLFDVEVGDGQRYCESASTMGGTESVSFQQAGFWIGLSVCYDLRFPELYRSLVDAGAELIVVPAAFTLATGKDHWHVLLRARAIESQAYVLAAGQWGTHPKGRRTYGKSLLVDPWGEVVAQASEGEGIVIGNVDRAYLEQVRANLPSLKHRRLGTPIER
jgi:deaminated glutathione amidase